MPGRYNERLARWRAALPNDRDVLISGLLVLLFVSIAAREIGRPYYGLHGYGQAQWAWYARAHVNYGLAYTYGLNTLAVGQPPPVSPVRYLDHPLLQGLLDAGAMALFGVSEWALRVTALIVYALTLLLLMHLFRRVFDDATAVLAVLVFVLLPITGYFYSIGGESHYSMFFLSVFSWWGYLSLIGDLGHVQRPLLRLWGLGIALFLLVQSDWVGVCYAAAIGTHYVGRCLMARRTPDRRLFLVLLLAPLAGIIIDFVALIGAGGWDVRRIIALYQFRSAATTAPGRSAAGWLWQQAEFLRQNFTSPVVIGALLYPVLLVAQSVSALGTPPRKFRHFWLFLGPSALYMVLLPEIFWVHQHAYMPLAIGLALAAALCILTLRDLVLVRHRLLGDLAAVSAVLIIAVFGAIGLNQYYDSRHYPPEVLNMFRRLNQQIPPDHGLLAFFNHVYQDSPSKPAFYRPEVAWYLDREIVTARTIEEIERLASAGRFAFYLADVPPTPPALVEELKRRYPFEHFKATEYQAGPPVIAYHPEVYLMDLRQAGRPAALPAATAQVRETTPAAAFLNQSLRDYQAGRFEDCMSAARQAAQLDPSSAEAFNNLGFCAGKLKLWDEAIRHTREAIRLKPDFQLAKNNLAWLEQQRLKPDRPESR